MMDEGKTNTTILAVIGLLAVVILCCTFLTWDSKIEGTLFIAAVISPVIGGGIGYVAGTKGVQQGSAASNSPPPPTA